MFVCFFSVPWFSFSPFFSPLIPHLTSPMMASLSSYSLYSLRVVTPALSPFHGSPPSPPLSPLPPHIQGLAPLTLAHGFPLNLERDSDRLAPSSPPQECWKTVHLLWIWLLFEILPYGKRQRPGFLHFLTLLFKHREVDFSHLISTVIKIWQGIGKPYWHPLPGELVRCFLLLLFCFLFFYFLFFVCFLFFCRWAHNTFLMMEVMWASHGLNTSLLNSHGHQSVFFLGIILPCWIVAMWPVGWLRLEQWVNNPGVGFGGCRRPRARTLTLRSEWPGVGVERQWTSEHWEEEGPSANSTQEFTHL